jgi:enoyl-CoA hydratase/carnithine racemase
VSVERDPRGIVTCWIDNLKRRNALTDGMLATLADTLEQARTQPDVRAIFLRGREGGFCAGRDLQELDAGEGESPQALARRIAPAQRLAEAVRGCAVPTVAVVEGKAVGLGVALATWCDLALASESATFMIPEARVGITPSFTLVSLVQAIGRRAALDLCLSGRSVDAAEALRLGLVQRLAGPSALDACVAELAQSFVKAGPQALRAAKALVGRTEGLPFDAALPHATASAIESMRNEEAAEGMAAFRDKRPPRWAGA